MSVVQVNQIKSFLKSTFDNIIQTDDARNDKEREDFFLTRSLMAYSILILSDSDPQSFEDSITDGFNDNGLDIIHYDSRSRELFIGQSKWSHDGSSTISRGDVQKFIKGIEDLVSLRFDNFNSKIVSKSTLLESIINDAETKFRLVIAHTSSQKVSDLAKSDINDFLGRINDTTDIMSITYLGQAKVHSAIAKGVENDPVNIDIALSHWGKVEEPYRAVYGSISTDDVARWWKEHSPTIFAPNIRFFLKNTDVNSGIAETLSENVQNFWYFNNGITALCKSFTKKALGGADRQVGFFECSNFQVINGAQTIGSIGTHYVKNNIDELGAYVFFKLIEIPDDDDRISKSITRYSNTQNKVDRRDFVSLDPEQERLKTELRIDEINYSYRSGETFQSRENGFDLVEATIARVCTLSTVASTAISRKEIGRFWDNINEAPYKRLFNRGLTGPELWKTVQCFRIVTKNMVSEVPTESRKKALQTHGDRFVAHVVFEITDVDIRDPTKPITSEDKTTLIDQARQVFDLSFEKLESDYPTAYIAHFFRNQSKCNDLKDLVLQSIQTSAT